MNARKSYQPEPTETTPLDARALLDQVHFDLVRVVALAQAAADALDGLPYPRDEAERRRLRILDALVSVTSDVATEALREADARLVELDG